MAARLSQWMVGSTKEEQFFDEKKVA